ncbi:MAG: hypothetical protein LBH59_07075 [Planctomycetaceae bacterium]|nr:hypothetical protein [Planctomycetaceae bacterium]
MFMGEAYRPYRLRYKNNGSSQICAKLNFMYNFIKYFDVRVNSRKSPSPFVRRRYGKIAKRNFRK